MPKRLWRKPDAIRCWAARRTEAGPDAGEPLVCVASMLGHVDEATGKRMIRMMLASGAKPDVPDENGMFPEEAARRSGASAELLKLLAAPPAANGRRARTVRPNGTNRHPRRPDPRPRFSTAAQRSNPEILQRNGSVSGKNRIRNRFVLSGLRENTAQRAAKP